MPNALIITLAFVGLASLAVASAQFGAQVTLHNRVSQRVFNHPRWMHQLERLDALLLPLLVVYWTLASIALLKMEPNPLSWGVACVWPVIAALLKAAKNEYETENPLFCLPLPVGALLMLVALTTAAMEVKDASTVATLSIASAGFLCASLCAFTSQKLRVMREVLEVID